MTKYRVFKKYAFSFDYVLKFCKAYEEYQDMTKPKNFDSVHYLISHRIFARNMIDFGASHNSVHHLRQYLKQRDIDPDLLLGETYESLQQFAIKYRDNLPKKFVNDFFRCRGLYIEPEIDEGYTTTEIDHELENMFW